MQLDISRSTHLTDGTIRPLMPVDVYRDAATKLGPIPTSPSATSAWISAAAIIVGITGARLIADMIDPTGTLGAAVDTVQPAFK